MPLARARGERVHQPREVLARLDRADIQHESLGQPIAHADPREPAAIGDRHGSRGRRLRERPSLARPAHRAARSRSWRALCDTVTIASATRAATPRSGRLITSAAQRMTAGKEPQAHVVNRDDASRAGAERQHPVGEVRDVGADLVEHAAGHHLHPHDAQRKPVVGVHADMTRQRLRRVDRLVGHDDQLVAGLLRPPARGAAAGARCSSRHPCGLASASCRQRRCAC